MGLYERLLGRDDAGVSVNNRIPVHGFQAVVAEFGRGRLTGAQAQTVVAELSGAALTPAEVTEANTLLATVSGSLTAKLARAKEIDDVLLLADGGEVTGYKLPSQIKTRLGV